MVGGLVQPCDACGDFARVASFLNCAVEADDDIVADFAPAALAVPLVDLRGGGVRRLPVASVRGGVPDDSLDGSRPSRLLTLFALRQGAGQPCKGTTSCLPQGNGFALFPKSRQVRVQHRNEVIHPR